METLSFHREREARIRRFLEEIKEAYPVEGELEAMLVYMAGNMVHQVYGSAYSFTLSRIGGGGWRTVLGGLDRGRSRE